jgi:hypothetical protein
MSAVATSPNFKENAHEALTDTRLQGALVHARNFTVRRAPAAFPSGWSFDPSGARDQRQSRCRPRATLGT